MESFEIETFNKDKKAISLLCSCAEITWNDKEVKAYLITIRDYTDLKHKETVKDNGIDMICCFDADCEITFANDAFCKYYEIPREIYIGTDMRSLMTKEESEQFLFNIAALNRDRPTHRILVKASDRIQDWIDHATFDKNGHIVQIQRTGRDITEIAENMKSDDAKS